MVSFIADYGVLISQIALVFGVLFAVWTTSKMRSPSGKKCPDCGESLPSKRIPKGLYELFIGGWTCTQCGAKLTHDLKKR